MSIRGPTFLFSSEANRKKFAADPEKYAPQYGGFCALGTANGYKVKTEPDAFKVVDGKLYLNYNRKVLEMWTQDQPGYISRANKNWPEVSKMPMKESSRALASGRHALPAASPELVVTPAGQVLDHGAIRGRRLGARLPLEALDLLHEHRVRFAIEPEAQRDDEAEHEHARARRIP